MFSKKCSVFVDELWLLQAQVFLEDSTKVSVLSKYGLSCLKGNKLFLRKNYLDWGFLLILISNIWFTWIPIKLLAVVLHIDHSLRKILAWILM